MKRTLSMIALAALTVGLLGSCSKINERLDNLEKEVSGIENEQIASINSQISGITSSITDLGQIRSDISSLKQSASDHSVDIFNLEEADRALKDRIVNLEDYVDAVLPNYAEKEWVEATFSTLAQYEATCDTIAKIDARIGSLDTKLSKDIKATADSLTKWVNKQFEGYYTAAEMDAKLAQMKSAVDSAKASGKITDAKADSIASELTNAKAAVDTAKANIRKEYRAAIDTAIKTSEGKLTKALQEKISDVNGKIESLTTRVGNLETSVNNLLGRVKALEEMIQSVVIVPAYSDGSVKIANDSLYIDCIVSPSKAVANLVASNVAVLVNKVKTKANTGVDTIKIIEGNVFEKDVDKGVISVRVFIKNKIPAAGSTLTVAVNVKKDKSDFTTEFVPVTRPVSVSLDKHSIVVPYRTLDSIVTLTAKVENSTKGVTWTSINTNIATVDANGNVTIKANILGKDTIVVTTVEGAKTDTCFVTVIPQDALPGVFSVSATKKVYFSKGNLWADGDKALHFEANQYSYASSWDASHVSHFTWSSTVEAAVGNSNSGDYLFCDESHKVEAIYYALSKDEWTYLFNNHSKKWATVNGVNGYVIDPDGFTGELASSYADDAALASAGNLVFLPAAGSRDGSSVEYVGDRGDYWSSTAGSDVSFSSDKVDLDRNLDRGSGCGVRLITDASAAPAPAPVAPEGFVDLGVKDANGKPLYWAEKNLGASKPWEYGNYFSWGDVTGQTPSGSTFSKSFNWDNNVFGQTFQKVAQNTACPNGILAPAYDAAIAANSSWRTPTSEEFKALAASCVWWKTDNYNNTGKAGYIVYKAKSDADKGKANMKGTWQKWGGSSYNNDSAPTESYSISDTHIFFPAAGGGVGTSLNNVGSIGYYWSSSLYSDNPDYTDEAYNLYISDYVDPQITASRYCGFSVRPVSD